MCVLVPQDKVLALMPFTFHSVIYIVHMFETVGIFHDAVLST